MTQQYGQPNINTPAGVRSFTSTVLVPNLALSISDAGKMVIVDSTAAASAITLPEADEAGAGAEITIIATVGSANAVTIAAAAGDALSTVALPVANPIVTDQGTLTLRSDGANTWYIVGGLVGA